MKTVLFLPGYRETIKSRDYKSVIDVIKSKGYAVKFIQINWHRTTIDDWVKQLEHEYAKYDAKSTILAGFSYGSMTAFVTAAKRNPAELWLCSLSPYFADDIPKLKQAWLNRIGKRRTVAFAKLDFATLAQKIHCETLLFVGELEAKKYPLIGERSKLAKKLMHGATLYRIAGVGHDVGDRNYIASIKSAI